MWDLLVYGGLDVTLSQDPSILSRISSAHPLFILRRMNLNFQIILSSFSPSYALYFLLVIHSFRVFRFYHFIGMSFTLN